MKKLITSLLVLVVIISILAIPLPVRATSILADDIWGVLSTTTLPDLTYSYSAMATNTAIIFSKADASAYDIVAQTLQGQSKWNDIFMLKRECELAEYDSATVEAALVQALNNIYIGPTSGLPRTFGSPNGFLVYHGFSLWAYKWARDRGISRWDVNKANNYLKSMYDAQGTEGILWITDAGVPYAADSRYYDEQAEVLRCFDILYHAGASTNYASSVWSMLTRNLSGDGGADSWWSSSNQLFWYRPYWKVLECEMGGFALIVSDYLGTPPTLVLQDMWSKLLRLKWGSPSWLPSPSATSGHAINHAYGGSLVPSSGGGTWEHRIGENVAVWRALQVLYPYFDATSRANLVSMLDGSADGMSAAQWIIHDSYYMSSQFGRISCLLSALLSAVVPSSGSLDLGFFEEGYITNHEFSSSKIQFDYTERRVRYPVRAGALTFMFGMPVSYTFPETATYDIWFGDSWSNIITVQKVGSESSGSGSITASSDVSCTGYISNSTYTSLAYSLPHMWSSVQVGSYTVHGTFSDGTAQSKSVTVSKDQTASVVFTYGEQPNPLLWLINFFLGIASWLGVSPQIMFFAVIGLIVAVGGFVGWKIRRSKHFSVRRH